MNGDGCSTICVIEVGWYCKTAYPPDCTTHCGDSLLVLEKEECDDGNNLNDDGCSSECKVDVGWECKNGVTCEPICGDGLLKDNEVCDDHNNGNCTSDCRGFIVVSPKVFNISMLSSSVVYMNMISTGG